MGDSSLTPSKSSLLVRKHVALEPGILEGDVGEGQLELAPGGVDEQVCAGSREGDARFGGAQGSGSRSKRGHRAGGGLHSQRVLEERRKKRCH